MSNKRTAREFWLQEAKVGEHTGTRYPAHITEIKPHYPEFHIHVREVLPDEISDTERLEWVINNRALVGCLGDKWYLYGVMGTVYGTTPREAIDAAIREEKKS